MDRTSKRIRAANRAAQIHEAEKTLCRSYEELHQRLGEAEKAAAAGAENIPATQEAVGRIRAASEKLFGEMAALRHLYSKREIEGSEIAGRAPHTGKRIHRLVSGF